MLSIIHALLWHFYKSHGRMFQHYTSFKHLVLRVLYESQIDANNLVSKKDEAAKLEEIWSCRKQGVYHHRKMFAP